jgi:hypothetical protein
LLGTAVLLYPIIQEATLAALSKLAKLITKGSEEMLTEVKLSIKIGIPHQYWRQ